MANLSDQIEANAAQPKRATFDGVSAEQHSLAEQIEADRYLKENAAVASPKRGLFLSRLKPGGTL